MKKIFYFLGVAALLLTVSCNKDNKQGGNDINWDNVTEDGFYVAGPATGSDEIKGVCVMTAGVNENLKPKAVREGMYEKYIVLEAGKEFYLLLNEAGTKTRYSATLAEFVTPTDQEAYGENPAKVLKGKLVTGNDAPAMKVEKTGLYHIVLDLNLKGDLDAAGGAQILLLDASEFGFRGGMNGWGFTAFPAPASFSNDGVVFEIKDVEIPKGTEFKFATGNYWKVTLDDAGKVKAETSLGKDLVPGTDDNIKFEEGGIMNVTLKFVLAAGAINKSFSWSFEKTAELVLDPKDFNVGISGGGYEGGWGDPAGSAKAEFVSTTATEKGGAGTYVYQIATVNVPSGTMKLRYNGGWYGVNQVDITGDLEYDGEDGADINVTKPGAYSVKFTAEWDGEALTSFAAEFTRLGDLLLDPSVFVVGVSGSLWDNGDGTWKDPFKTDELTTLATFKSKDVTDAATLAGTYVYEVASVPAKANGEFKLRFNGAWLKAETESTVEGVEVTSTGGGDPNFKFAAGTDGNYKVTITAVWDGEKPTSVVGKFEKL